MTRFGLPSLLVFCGLILLWEAAVLRTGVSEIILPAPSAVAAVLYDGLVTGFLWPHIWITTTETLLGLFLGCSIGFLSGLLLSESSGLRRLLWPYILASQVVPKLALGPLFIIWFGFGMKSTVIITALICFFPLLENTLTGLDSAPREKRDLFRMLGANRLQTLFRLKIPFRLYQLHIPRIFSKIIFSLGLFDHISSWFEACGLWSRTKSPHFVIVHIII